MTDFKFSRSLF